MGELSVRRNREAAVPRFKGTGKTEKAAGAAKTQKAPGRAAATVSETLRRLMGQVDQAGRQLREGRRTLQRGEAALAEVDGGLERMEELAREAAEGGEALQDELDRLRAEIGRVTREGIEAGLFRDGDGLDTLADAVLDSLNAARDPAQSLPGWLLRGMGSAAPDRSALLAALGLGGNPGGPELLAALGRLPLDSSPAAGYLAGLYLGAVISGGAPPGTADPEQAAEGLRQLLEAVAEGISPDEAVNLLTGGAFTSLEDFQARFSGGTAPGLDAFLTQLLLSGGGEAMPSVLDLLAGDGTGEMALLIGLLDALGGSGDGLAALLDGAGNASSQVLETTRLGTAQVSGADLSGAAFDAQANTLTAGGGADLTLRGLGQEAPAIRLAGTGTVTLQQIDAPLLNAESARGRLVTAGENALAQLRLAEGAELTVDGGGLLRMGLLRGGAGSILRLAGGMLTLDGTALDPSARVVADGPALLLAARDISVSDPQGRPLTPFDAVWKALLPGWSAITSLSVDGRMGRLALTPQDRPDFLRLWLFRGSEQDRPVHTLVFRGRDRAGHPRTRYVYVRWDQGRGSFQEVPMYPNPFTVTGGEQDADWRYEEGTQTLYILTNEVASVSGGAGTDGEALPFSGRLALADGIGPVELALDGVECRVAAGRAFTWAGGTM